MTNRNFIGKYLSLESINSLDDFLCLLPQINKYPRHDFRDTERVIHDLARHEADDRSHERSHVKTNLNSLSDASAISYSESIAIGTENSSEIATGSGNDFIFGLADANAVSEAQAIALAKSLSNHASTANANSQSIAQSLALATGISNVGKISTRSGNDVIFGLANANAVSKARAIALAKLFSDNASTANANSESIAEAIAGTIGIANSGEINTGSGNDITIGVASTSTSVIALAEAKAILKANGSDDVSSLLDAKSTSAAVATAQTQTLGINNLGNIFTGYGHDLILGLASAENLSKAIAFSETRVVSNSLATAIAEGESSAVVDCNTVGIVNSGKISTGQGHDTIIGIAINDFVARANADAEAVSMANDSGAESDTFSFSDTLATIAIGIDNSSGIIRTGKGNDRIVGNASTIGILGGEIQTGEGRDRIVGKGSSAGIVDSIIYAGVGDDYLQAARIEIDSSTGNSTMSEDQTGSISNAKVYGNSGNDTFEIGGFAGNVAIDGGSDFDVLKLWGNIDRYQISLGSDGRTLTIEDSDSILTAKNVEEFYFGSSQYNIGDFA